MRNPKIEIAENTTHLWRQRAVLRRKRLRNGVILITASVLRASVELTVRQEMHE